MIPLRTKVTVSKPRWGWFGKPGTTLPWYMLKPSRPEKSWPMSRSPRGTAGARRSSPAG
jgi:hypothetical protein